MRRKFLSGLLLFLFICISSYAFAQTQGTKKVLILAQGSSDLRNISMADARQLGQLLGHFNTRLSVKGIDEYNRGELNSYDYIFYLGFYVNNSVPARFMDDVYKTQKPVIWINTGIVDFSAKYKLKEKFGFNISRIDSVTGFDQVRSGGKVFSKGEEKCHIIDITEPGKADVLATAYSSKKHREVPYIIKALNFWYIADSPFAYAAETDRYLLFADMLHDILHEDHENSHSAILRIEDINLTDNPDRIRELTDILSERNIPFLLSVIPFYVNPAEGIRLSLSDKPDFVDALKYAVKNGASIVMHGSTHQYRDITAGDFEFWDSNSDKPIKEQTAADIRKKIELGIQEFMKNGLYPVAWETPHYTASQKLYETVSEYFSSSIEQRMSVENSAYSQFFPYIINRDLFGQKIYPENLGYVPQDKDINVSRKAVQNIIKGARVNLNVRDGFASCFFHSFLDLSLLEELVDGIMSLGYTYIDLKEHTNWVKTKDRIILTGPQNYTLHLSDQYLEESYFDVNGGVIKKTFSDSRFTGNVKREIKLNPGELYKAEPLEYREHDPGLFEKFRKWGSGIFNSLVKKEEDWQDARAVILWNHYARGASYNDQSSLAAVLRSVNIKVDTIFYGQNISLSGYNLLIVPFSIVDSLKPKDYDIITGFVNSGGNIITDSKNELAGELGIRFSEVRLKVHGIRDKFYPDERIFWKETELVNKFALESSDEVFCSDENTGTPLAIGRRVGSGRMIFFASRFDPNTPHGYSLYPYLMEYIRKYFSMKPVIRRDMLEVYFDPGFRHTISVENLVKQWVKQGIRIIHVPGWIQYPKYTYDYERLIDLAHANGILVYCWFEPPQVSLKFWTEHPEWREKNYLGQDVSPKMQPTGPSWRYPVALTDPQCVKAMTDEYTKLLRSHDWDGVNLAELYFEAGQGFDSPVFFTPMHISAQNELKARYGIELNKIFQPGTKYYWKTNPEIRKIITDYRVEKLNDVYSILLSAFREIASRRNGFQVIVTAMDSHIMPELKEYHAVDMERIIKLQKQFGFVLQVEDPQAVWSTDPFRYKEIGKLYTSLLGDSTRLMLDLNIMKFRNSAAITPFPTLIQTGTESYQLVNAASVGAPRLSIYAESSVNPQDLFFLPYALASRVEYSYNKDVYQFNSPYSFYLSLPPKVKEIVLDGIPLSPSRENNYLIPAGSHAVKFNSGIANSFSTHNLQTKIMSITANLLSVKYGMQDIVFEYEGDTRVLLALNREPYKIKIDGQEYDFKVMHGNDCYTVFLPPGSHRAEIKAGNAFEFGISLTSLWSSVGIAIFGAVAVTLLAVMYIALKIYKRKFN